MNTTLGMYNGCILHADARIPNGVSGADSTAVTTVRRAVFAGAQAVVMGYGRDNGPNRFTWVEELNQLGLRGQVTAH